MMMNQSLRNFVVLKLFLFLSVASFAQNNYTVSGSVTDEDAGIPLEYATITFNDPSGKLSPQGGVTDFDGNFSIEVKEGTYNIIVEYISFKPKKFNNRTISKDMSLGTVRLGLNADSLDEVVVRSETTQVDVRLDKKIYNIGKDLTTQGATVSDALSNVPSVTVDVEGAISLRGNENVKILINGKPSAMAGFGDTDVFKQLPADAIERVEVITSPSARYDAEGTAGILNIILRKEKTLGLNGSVSANLGYPANSSISANLNLRTDKFNIFNTTGVYYRKAPGNAFFDNRYYGDSLSVDRSIEDRDYDRRRQGINTNLGMQYYLTESSSITGSVFMRFGDDKDISTNYTSRYLNNTLVNETTRAETEKEEDESYQYALNYENKFNDEGHKLTADLQYSYDNEDRPTSIVENFNFPTETLQGRDRIFENEKQKEFLIQADYVLPMGEAQFEAGYRGNFEEQITDYNSESLNLETNQFEIDSLLTNKFTYKENVNAVYTQYGNKIGKFSFLLGLRLEQTQLKGKIDSEFSDENALQDELGTDIDVNFDKDYLGLFPTVNLIYELGEEENISIGYNRRINRPRGWYINPFPSRSSRTNIFQGNPDLDPAYSDAFDIGYLKQWDKLTLTSSIYYQHETESFERIQEDTGNTTTDGEKIIRSIPINLAENDRFGGELGIIYNPQKWLRLNGSFNIYNSTTKGDFNGVNYDSENTSWFARFSSKVTLPSDIQWQTTGFYRGPSRNATTESDGIFFMNLAFSKDIIKDVATISLNVSDVFNTRKRSSFTNNRNGVDDLDYFTSNSEFQWRERQITLGVVYRFNQPKNQRGRNGNNNQGMDEGGDYEG
ncbi:TonB-dependent receptor domain-containing protein [Mesonia ostreae]|uniref:Outer membrane beta-barrel family protein n=1 Tax=Mesonia ostreae TaxID=861110 RepID=A0ABU2KJV5_9FLAO|nr:outer membrane beta-barrel family protein [Mesonia ostreae]MDT0294988.1 outer membrane beta-barrel family protein [Mesonia ostreae]